jgi:energy-coupling factor transport system ATP-binding protein
MSIQIKHMSHLYMPGTPFESAALSDITLTLEQHEFVGLIGHTGSGKSTLVQHINGLLKPTGGSINVFGVELTDKNADLKRVRRDVGLVFQYPEHQLFEETVERDVAFGPTNMGLSGEELAACVREAIERVGLDFEAVRSRSPFELSGGQRRRVAIAGVIAMRPKFLILDEPTAGLDPRGRNELLDLVRQLHQRDKTGILLITHSMDDIARAADRIVVIDKGRIVMDGTPQQVFSHASQLEEIGLDVPQTTRLRMALAQRGIDMPDDIFDAQGAAAFLLSTLRR